MKLRIWGSLMIQVSYNYTWVKVKPALLSFRCVAILTFRDRWL